MAPTSIVADTHAAPNPLDTVTGSTTGHADADAATTGKVAPKDSAAPAPKTAATSRGVERTIAPNPAAPTAAVAAPTAVPTGTAAPGTSGRTTTATTPPLPPTRRCRTTSPPANSTEKCGQSYGAYRGR
jgi:hypothetical protein